MRSIKEIIDEKLDEIEKRENVKILHCVESGSRAWGFPSPDSDYDVRFIYVRPKEYYLRLDKAKDVIEWQLDDTLDINGWDLQKALRLLHKSNQTLFEWNNSPIIYRTSDEWDVISKVFDRHFNVISGLYHYLSTAKSNYREYLKGDSVRLKKYFYVLRPLLACEYIRDNMAPPPMLFEELLCYLDGDVLCEVRNLLEQKKITSELGDGKKISCINEYIERKIEEFDKYVSVITPKKKNDWDELNKLFISICFNTDIQSKEPKS